jgi:hypothetical protein
MVKRILLGITIVIVLLVSGFVIVVSQQPNSYAVERSTTIKATPEAIFPLVNDFHGWSTWTPFHDLDPKATYTISEPSSGKGAIMTWDGNDKVGAGAMVIVDSKPHEVVLMEQSFTRPQQGKCDVIFSFIPVESETKVTWQFKGEYGNFLEKAMCMVMNLDAMLGPKMEQGLRLMKTVAEEPIKDSPF